MVLAIAAMLYSFHVLASQKQSPKPLQLLSSSDWQNLASNDAVLYRGKVEYQLRCIKCHGPHLEGTYKATSLTDDTWLYGNSYNDIYTSIHQGNGNMKGYGKKLLNSDIQAITVFIKTTTDAASN